MTNLIENNPIADTERLPRLSAARQGWRDRRSARYELITLERELAAHTSASDIADLSALLGRHDDTAVSAEVHRILEDRIVA